MVYLNKGELKSPGKPLATYYIKKNEVNNAKPV
jgi:hypothetical protein